MTSPRSRLRASAAATLLGVLCGCGGAATDSSAAATVRRLSTALVDEPDPAVLWQALPESYRRDVSAWAAALAAKAPVPVYEQLFDVIRRAGLVLKTRGDLLARTVPLELRAALRNADEEDLAAASLALGDALMLLGSGPWSHVAGLQSLDIDAALRASGRRMLGSALRASRVLPQDASGFLRVTSVEQLAATQRRVRLRIATPAWTREVAFRQVDQQWVPELLADRWPDLDRAVRAALDAFDPRSSEARAAEGWLQTLRTSLDSLAAAKDRPAVAREFDKLRANLLMRSLRGR
ncbi:MAG: hypothetical protein KDC87_08010 [Planctomycetes bacterium]|nr:hypothetical protein [Planctomycetota bacterium]MCB9871048.1 hypothetical protein [Planctomycetota bacterium]